MEICYVNRSQTCFNRAPVPGTYKSVRTGGEVGGGWGKEVLSSKMVIYNVSGKKTKIKTRTGKGRVLD